MEAMVLARNWGAIAVRGIAAILFGLLTFVLPGVTLAALVLLFGAYALVARRTPHTRGVGISCLKYWRGAGRYAGNFATRFDRSAPLDGAKSRPARLPYHQASA
jgi:hypothetical protein